MLDPRSDINAAWSDADDPPYREVERGSMAGPAGTRSVEVDVPARSGPPVESGLPVESDPLTQSELTLPELEARITELAGHLNAATHRWLVLLAEFDRREGWADGSMRSCAHWLGWKCGLDLGAAREKLRVAHALETLPRIAAAMARGELSYSKVRALTRVATADTEETLLMIALHGTAHHVEAVVRGYRRAQQAEALSREALQHAGRGLRWHHDDDGSLVMQVRLPAEGGALLLRALQCALDEDRAGTSASPPQRSTERGRTGADVSAGTSVRRSGAAANSATARRHVPAETSGATATEFGADAEAAEHVPAGTFGRVSAETFSPIHAGTPGPIPAGAPGSVPAGTPDPSLADTPAQRRADALVRLAESWLADGGRALRGGERQQLVVHVDMETLAASVAGRSELDDGPALAAETVRRLGCDASLVAIVEGRDGRVLDVGRRTRSIPPAIARALRSRDRGCRFPGCTHARFVDGHHIEHWAHGGATRLSNLVLLCRRHHRQVHEGGVTVRALDDGAIVFTDAIGRRIEAAPPTAGASDWVTSTHAREGLRIDPHTATGQWNGERLDLDWTVAGLCAILPRADPARPGASP